MVPEDKDSALADKRGGRFFVLGVAEGGSWLHDGTN